MKRKVTIKYKKIRKIYKVDVMSDWDKVADFLVDMVKPGVVIALSGDLGVGKTTLTQFIAKKMGAGNKALSPTFALIKNYHLRHTTHDVRRLVHVDAYRIENLGEAMVLDLDDELLEPGTAMIIEWPEKIGEIVKRLDPIQVGIEAGMK